MALLRLGLTNSLNTVWAEDGPIYLQAALTQDFWHAVASFAGDEFSVRSADGGS